MADCCAVKTPTKLEEKFNCPKCGNDGKKVEVVTLKSLLVPDALAKLSPQNSYRMCSNETCDVVYFNEQEEIYTTEDVKVAVFQKTDAEDCPVCYCFGWSRDKIKKELEETGKSTAADTISEHIKAGRCGCDVNNPQGSCCLGNVKKTVKEYTSQNN